MVQAKGSKSLNGKCCITCKSEQLSYANDALFWPNMVQAQFTSLVILSGHLQEVRL